MGTSAQGCRDVEAADEAAVCFVAHRGTVRKLGFADSQVLTFGSVRGSNALKAVARLHVVGRPMPPGDELVYLAQVLHHDDAAISGQLVVRPRTYGGQPFAADVVDFADSRVAALLRAGRDDEITQVLHRARFVELEPQAHLAGITGATGARARVRLVLHTSHPVPGLRVDELHTEGVTEGVNEQRRRDAATRIWAAVAHLKQENRRITVTSVAAAAGAHKATQSDELEGWGDEGKATLDQQIDLVDTYDTITPRERRVREETVNAGEIISRVRA